MTEPNVHELRQSLMELNEAMIALLDATDGYRQQLTERDYSLTAAEAMAMEFHAYLLALLFKEKS